MQLVREGRRVGERVFARLLQLSFCRGSDGGGAASASLLVSRVRAGVVVALGTGVRMRDVVAWAERLEEKGSEIQSTHSHSACFAQLSHIRVFIDENKQTARSVQLSRNSSRS